MNVKFRKENGITLVALVVTVVVLLILASISIGSLTNEGGMISESKDITANAERESIIQKIEADLYTEKTKTGKEADLTKLKEIIQKGNYSEGTPGESSFTTKDGGYTIQYDEILGWRE